MKENNKLLYIKNNYISLLLIAFYILTLSFYKTITTNVFFETANLEIGFDKLIPFVPILILVYHTYFFFLMIIGIYLYFKDRKICNTLYLSLIIAQLIAYIIFIFYPTDISSIRPIIKDNDIFSYLTKLTYEIDTIYAGMPSLHTSSMTIIILTTCYTNFKKINKCIISLYALLIISTTVLVKQHVFLDIPGGIILGIICFYISKAYIYNKKKQN